MIDITMTACKRPEIIERTLSSFRERMFDGSERLIINVDNAGLDNISQYDIVELARRYFSKITYRTPKNPSFPDAFKWVWLQAKADYIFHLEDDWELLQPVDVTEMLSVMSKNKDLVELRLPDKKSNSDKLKSWNKFIPWNGEFFEVPESLKFSVGHSGHPTLIRGVFVKKVATYIDGSRNPEKQFHGNNFRITEELKKWRIGAYGGPDRPPFVRDIGRRWMVNNGFRKHGSKAYFTQWERTES